MSNIRRGILVFIGVPVAIVAAMGYCMMGSAPPTDSWRNNASAARTLCQSAIRESLKNPAAAEYPHISLTDDIGFAAEDPGIIRVRTYVDAPNDFGLMIRTSFQCDCREIDGHWQLVNVGTF